MRKAAVVLCLLCGCSLDLGAGDDRDDEPVVVSKVEHMEIPLASVRQYDILLVVDSAPTMAAEAEVLVANAREFIHVLEQVEGGMADVHIGVVDSDLGTLGVDVGDPRCVTSPDQGRLETFGCGGAEGFLADEIGPWGERSTNYTGELGDALACIVERIGATGCPWRQPLEAARRALDDGERNGFLRPDGMLYVLFVGDADDCSTANPALFAPGTASDPRTPFRCFAHGVVCDGPDDPATVGPRTGCRPRTGDPLLRSIEFYRDDLRARKPGARDVIVSAVTPLGEVRVAAGPRLANSCQLDALAGTPAIRLVELLKLFPDRNTWTTSCDLDWTDAFIQLVELLRTVIGYPCIRSTPLDLDPVEPGLQPDIAVWIDDSRGVLPGPVLRPCSATPSDELCYRLEPDPLNCVETPSTLTLRLEPPLFVRVPAILRADLAVE